MTDSFDYFKGFRRKRLLLLLWCGVAILAIFVLTQTIHYADVWQALQASHGGWLVLAFVTIVGTQFLKIVRWRELLQAQGIYPTWGELLKVQLIGQGLNTFLPLRVGEIARVQWLQHYDRAIVLSSITIEKSADLLCFGVMGIALVLGATLPPFLQGRFMDFAITTILAITTVIGLLWMASETRLTQLTSQITWLHPFIAPYTRFRWGWRQIARPRDTFLLLGVSGAIWAMAILTNLCLFAAFSVSPIWVSGIVLLVILQIGITIATVPATIGIFEYLCILTLGWFEVPSSVAFSIAITLHLLVLIPSVLGIWFARPTSVKDI